MNGKYVEQYIQVHNNKPQYGKGACVKFLLEVIALAKEHKCRSILDYGCGKGRAVEGLNKEGFKAYGYDPAIPKYSDALEVLGSRSYDLILSTDVFEHIPRKELEDCCLQLYLMRPKVFYFHISCRLAKEILPNGDNAHCTVWTPEMWEEWLEKWFNTYSWSYKYFEESQGVTFVGIRDED